MHRAAWLVRGVLPLLSILALPATAAGQQQPRLQPRPLSLDDAVRMAQASSEAITIARAAIDDAAGERQRATGARLPRLDAYSSVDRALRSEYDGLDFGAPAPADDDAAEAPALPFGSPTTYRVGLTFSQSLFSGGRTIAIGRAAARGEQAATIALASRRAQVTLDVAQAYYDAVLAGQLVEIVDATLAQAEGTLERAALRLKEGRGSEFEYLRAKVARDRQRPVVVRQRGERDVAMLRLRQLVHVPAGSAIVLTTPLEPGVEPSPTPALLAVAFVGNAGDPAADVASHAAVREAAARLEQRRQLLRSARAQRWPGVALTTGDERVAYARDDLPANREFRTNWTVGARIDLPLLTGGQRPGDEARALAAVTAARADLELTEQLAELMVRSAATQLAAAREAWLASEGGVAEATRAHEIAALRHREGLAIQLELSDARLALEAARSERARAARDLLVERLRTSLLAELPPASR